MRVQKAFWGEGSRFSFRNLRVPNGIAYVVYQPFGAHRPSWAHLCICWPPADVIRRELDGKENVPTVRQKASYGRLVLGNLMRGWYR